MTCLNLNTKSRLVNFRPASSQLLSDFRPGSSSEVKVHKEAEHLSAVNPVLRQLGGMLGGGGGGGRTVVAGQSPLTAAWLPPPQSDAATAAPLAAGTAAPLAEDAETAAALREAVSRLPRDAGLAAGVYRIETSAPDGLYHVLIGNGELLH